MTFQPFSYFYKELSNISCIYFEKHFLLIPLMLTATLAAISYLVQRVISGPISWQLNPGGSSGSSTTPELQLQDTFQSMHSQLADC